MALRLGAFLFTLSLAGVLPLHAQPVQTPTPAAATAAAGVPVRVEVVIARYQGDKRVSRLPFTLFVNATRQTGAAEQPTRLRVGVEVPIVAYQLSTDAKPTANAAPTSAIQYRPFGTNLDCSATALDDGRFSVTLSIEDSAPYSEQDKPAVSAATNEARTLAANPVFRSFRVSNVLVLREGQSTQVSTWTDRFSGEQVRLDVTLSVVK